MRLPTVTLCSLFTFLYFIQLVTRAFASKKSYVVYLGSHSHGPEFSAIDFNQVRKSHHEFLGSFLESNEVAQDAIFYSYTRHINGFAANLDDRVAARIAKHPKVVSVFLNRGRKLHTTHSWSFLRLEEQNGLVASSSIWKKARYGQDVIIGNLDTGVWPESKSFSDEELGPIPSKWRGICQSGSDPSFHCNRKLIGARYFNKGYASVVGKLNSKFNSPRDIAGHGSHTLSTAGGNFVSGANVFGYGNGTAKGGSPKARVAAYRVCYPPINGDECFDADVIAAFDAAIGDGVDVLSVSLGGDPTALFNDSVAIGSFHAIKHGIVVVCSAGNAGPAEGTVSNVAPWEITVGASTMDREFPSYARLGNGMTYKGESLSAKFLRSKLYPLLSAADARTVNVSATDALMCKAGTLDPKKVKGKIIVCLRGDNARVDKGEQVALAGGVGMILANNYASGDEILADLHVLPATHINYTNGEAIFAYVNSTKSPVASITPPITRIGTKPAPFMAAFSSKGPNTVTPEILKPDVTAPGVSIIAAYTRAQGPANQDFDKRRVLYNSISGTSMSCPHVSGIAGLLRALYPKWSPAAIKSAIMTTATIQDNNMEQILNASYGMATPFSYGAGHVRPNKAMNPGLVYDLTTKDYLNFLCTLGYNSSQIQSFSLTPYTCPTNPINLSNFNYPSITIPNLKTSVTVTRTVKNVGSPSTYSVHVRTPREITISVNPESLKFKRVGEVKTFKVTIKAKKTNPINKYVFGDLVWFDKTHIVRSPIVVKL